MKKESKKTQVFNLLDELLKNGRDINSIRIDEVYQKLPSKNRPTKNTIRVYIFEYKKCCEKNKLNVNTSTDASINVSTDVDNAVIEKSIDASIDTSTDVNDEVNDKNIDASIDASIDTSISTSTDTSTDISTNTSTNTSTDTSINTSTDTNTNTSIDTNNEVNDKSIDASINTSIDNVSIESKEKFLDFMFKNKERFISMVENKNIIKSHLPIKYDYKGDGKTYSYNLEKSLHKDFSDVCTELGISNRKGLHIALALFCEAYK